MSRQLTLAIIETLLQLFSALVAGAGMALPWRVARQCQVAAQAGAFGPLRIAGEEPRPPRLRRMKPPDGPINKVNWTV